MYEDKFAIQFNVSHLDYGIKANGWQWFVDTKLQQSLDWCAEGGVTDPLIVLHNPGFTPVGVPGGMMFQIDQFLPRTEHLPVGMTAARHQELAAEYPIVMRGLRDDGYRVHTYLGAARWIDPIIDPYNSDASLGLGAPNYNDPDLAALRDPFEQDDWMEYIQRCLKPALDGGTEIGFDTLARITPVHPMFGVVNTLKSLGTNVVIEPSPPLWSNTTWDHWKSFDVLDQYKTPEQIGPYLASMGAKWNPYRLIQSRGNYANFGHPSTNFKARETYEIRQSLHYNTIAGAPKIIACFRSHTWWGNGPGVAEVGVKCSDLTSA